ncbi:MAG TPA: ShlB/FhaC/HecB family hemolysin secretion/activation protein [Allosphingosinicella sp.]|nr:ShlB/FhaC/HecB family hemolysin secretion/activation protein [Allosphingosinicella sp.]
MFKSGLATIGLLIASQTALAQQVPLGAGGQLQQIPPATAPDKPAADIRILRPEATRQPDLAGSTIRVNQLIVDGNLSFPDADLVAASGVTPGSDLTLGQLRDAAASIAAYYNARGFILAQAYVPAQDVSAGNVTIAVVEGRLGAVEIRNNSTLSGALVRNVLGGLDEGAAVTAAPLERRLLLLSDIPGVRVSSTLAPGAEVGTSNLLVDVAPGRAITGSIEADNGGNRYTGEYRAGGTIYFNNPTGSGDQASLRLLGSTGGLAYGRAAYQTLVGKATVGAAFTHLRYALGREFEVLDADGTADILSVFGSYPLIRSRTANLNALAGVEARRLEDRLGSLGAEGDKRIGAGTLGLSGDSRDTLAGGGWNAASLGWTLGHLNLDTPLERAIDAATARSQGRYNKVQFTAARLQTLSGPLSLYGSLRGQLAFDNLDSSEKMQLGGAYGVRAYPEGEAYGDEGYLATLEARLLLSRWTGSLPGQIQLIGFADVGEVRYANDPWFTGSNHTTRSGIGAGLTWAGSHGLVARTSYATRLGDQPVTSGPDKSGRFWFQISKLF